MQSYTQFCPCYTFSPPSLYHILGCHKEDSQLLFFPVIATGLILRLWSSLCYFCHRVFNTYIFFPTSIHLYSHTNNGGLVLLSHLYLQIFDEKGSRVCMKQKKGISNNVHGRNAFTNLIYLSLTLQCCFREDCPHLLVNRILGLVRRLL